METRVYTEENDIPVAAASLRLGGLVAVPTETVYGLCANVLTPGRSRISTRSRAARR